MKYTKIYNCLRFTKGQVVLIVLLVGTFELFFGLWTLRTENTSDPNVFFNYLGFPFKAIKIKNIVRTGIFPDVGKIVTVKQYYQYLWDKITMNLISYAVFSIVVVKLATSIRDEIEYRRHYKS